MKRQGGTLAVLLALTASLYLVAYFLPVELNLWRLWLLVRGSAPADSHRAVPQVSGLAFHLVVVLAYSVSAAWAARRILELRTTPLFRLMGAALVVSLAYFAVINVSLLWAVLPGPGADALSRLLQERFPFMESFYHEGGLRRFFLPIVLTQAVLTYALFALLVGRSRPPRPTTSAPG